MARQSVLLVLALIPACPVQAAESVPDAAPGLLGRDVALPRERPNPDRKIAPTTVEPGLDANVQPLDVSEIQIGAVHVVGATHLEPGAFADIVERHIGLTTDANGLQALARAMAERARERGYIFSSAAVPKQDVNIGIIRVDLDEGAVDEVQISGSNNGHLRRVLDDLLGKAVPRARVERQLLLAGDIPGITILSTRYARENGRGVLFVQAKERRARGSAFIDNAGSPDFGPVRARLEFELNGLLDSDDRLSISVVATPAQPRELTFVATRYSNIIAANGTQIAISAAAGRTHATDKAAAFEAVGHSRYLAASISTPLIRSNDANIWLSGEIAYLTVDQDFMTLAFQRDDIVTVTLSGSGSIRMAGGRLHAGLDFTRGLGILGATSSGDPFASRADGSGEFTKAQAWLNWSGKLGGGLTLRIAALGQIASRPLLGAQEIGLGGPGFGRAFDFSERFGDQGVMGLVELRRRFDAPLHGIDWAQPYVFVDGGYIDNLRGGFGGGTLLSAGSGLRAGIGEAEMGFELALPIQTGPSGTGYKSPEVNFSVGYRF